MPQFPQFWLGLYVVLELMWGLNELTYIKPLELYWVRSKCYANVSQHYLSGVRTGSGLVPSTSYGWFFLSHTRCTCPYDSHVVHLRNQRPGAYVDYIYDMNEWTRNQTQDANASHFHTIIYHPGLRLCTCSISFQRMASFEVKLHIWLISILCRTGKNNLGYATIMIPKSQWINPTKLAQSYYMPARHRSAGTIAHGSHKGPRMTGDHINSYLLNHWIRKKGTW